MNDLAFVMTAPSSFETPSSRLPVGGVDLGNKTAAMKVAQTASSDALKVFAPAATNLAYAAGQAIGTHVALSVFNIAGGSGRIASIMLTDNANQKSALTLLFFRGLPTTAIVDKTAVAIFTANEVCAVHQVAAADYVTVDSKAFANYGDLNVRVDNADSTASKNLYLVVVSQGTPNYGASAAGALRIKVGLEQ